MSSPASIKQEAQGSTPIETSQSQVADSAVGQATAEGSTSASASTSTSISPSGGSTSALATQVTPSSTLDAGPSAVVVPRSPAAGAQTPRVPHCTGSEPLQDPLRAKFVVSPGYVVPAPSFSYSVFPRANSPGMPHQSAPVPALKLTPSMPPAALQPPVPGQPLGNRPSFSYNVVPQANSISPSGQQFQPATATNQVQLHGVRFTPPMAAASLQPPVPGQFARSNLTTHGMATQNARPPVQLPLPILEGQLSSSNNFSFSGSSQSAATEASKKDISLPTSCKQGTSNTVAVEAGTSSTASVGSQSKSSSADNNMLTTSSTSSSVPPTASSSSNLTSPPPSISARPMAIGSTGTPGLPAVPNSSTMHRTPDTSLPALRPMMPSSAMPSNYAPFPVPPSQNAQQQTYQHYPSLAAMVPPPQVPWSHLHPPLSSGLQQGPFVPYPGAHPAPFPLPMRGMPLSSVPMPTAQPPGVSMAIASEPVVSTETSSHPGGKLGTPLLPPGIDNGKQANDLPKDGGDTRNGQIDAWTSHRTDSGAIYYYNSITKESTYTKPSSFKGEPEKVSAQPTPTSWEKFAGTDWMLVTTSDGKKYYYDTKNKVSSWQAPPVVAELNKIEGGNSKGNATQVENASAVADKVSSPVQISTPAVHTGGRDSLVLRSSGAQVPSSALDLIKKKLQDAGAPVTSSSLPVSTVPATTELNGSRAVDAALKGQQNMNSKDKAKDANVDGNLSDSSSDSDDAESGPTKEECIIQFKEMLKERGVAPFSKWEKELPKILFDPRFKAVPGNSARRSIFEHFVRTRAEEERKEKRAAQKAAVDGFKQLLEEASEEIDHKTDYHSFKRKWGKDPRFEALDRKEREFLLNEKVLPLKRATEGKIQAIHTAAVNSFKAMLRENKDITTNCRWSKVKDSMRNDSRYKGVKHEERELLFNEYLAELKASEDEAEKSAKIKREEQDKLKEREREMRKRKEREEQEMERIRLKVRRKEVISSFQALLVETIKDPKASWTESKPKLEKDPQGRATNPDLSEADAEKLFRDHVKDLYERCARDYRTLLAEVITVEAATKVTDGGKNVLNSWTEAKHLLKPDPRYSKMPRKERESLWSRHAEDTIRKHKTATTDSKEKVEKERKRERTSDFSRRSHNRR
ncbi:pre-mRNA-processing protein 40C [Iris pallida]|uniref:Pre-mRNA-processing protein 40C n=1 Tax=Iris pallida TaxID=29817 RepID=A0AAX6HH47_IRIPA|nr:pre-mRNA-processing protein 40C [Iris pallida]